MPTVENPLTGLKKLVAKLQEWNKNIFIDFHAEVTSEKELC